MRDIVQGKDYEVSKWKEFDNFECVHCEFSSLFIERMQLHFDNESKHLHIWNKPGKEPWQPQPESQGKLTY